MGCCIKEEEMENKEKEKRTESLLAANHEREKREVENFELLVPFLLLHLWKNMQRKRDERAPAKQKTKRKR